MVDITPMTSAMSNAANYTEDIAKLDLTKAQTNLLQMQTLATGVKAQVEQAALNKQQRILTVLDQANRAASPSGLTPEDMQQNLINAANKLLPLDPKTAGEIATEGTKIGTYLAQQNDYLAKVDTERLNQSRLHIKYIGELAAGVYDQTSLDRANANYAATYATTTGQLSPFAGRRYDAALAEELHKVSTQAIDADKQIEIALKERQQRSLETHRQFEETLDNLRTKSYVAKNNADIAYRNFQMKDGGNARMIHEPTKDERLVALQFVSQAIPDMNDDDASNLALEVAAKAKAMYTSKPGLSPAQARQQVLEQIQRSGRIQAATGISKYLNIIGMGETTLQPENSAIHPQALPADRKLVPGTYYQTSKGVSYWDGKQGILQGSNIATTKDDKEE